MLAVGSTAGSGPLRWGDYLVAQGLVTSVQLFAQLTNEHFDQETDAHPSVIRTAFSGGSGVLGGPDLGTRVAIRAATAAAWAAVALTVVAATIDWRLGVIGATAIAGAWWYSAPPTRLVATGFGEISASVIVAAMVPATGAIVRGGLDIALLAALVTPLVLAHTAMVLALSAPDEETDAATGKRTLWVRLGADAAGGAHLALLLGTVVASGVMAPLRPDEADWATLAVLPPAIGQQALLLRRSDRPGLLTLTAVGTFVVLAAALGVGTALGG